MRGRPSRRLLLGAMSVAVALTPALSATATTSSGGSPGRAHQRTDQIEEYVALGDSYTAGPLVPLIRLDPLGCVRSTSDYPSFLATYLRVSDFSDVSCSAARTRHAREPQTTFTGTNPPQLDALTSETDLVTLGIGGNDYGLFGELVSTCPTVRSEDPSGSPCKDRFTVDGVDTKMRDARRIRGRVAGVVRRVHGRSPHAEVVVIGYPRIVPPRGTCPDVVPFADGDYRWADRVERRLNASLREAAERGGAAYVDMYPASYGHDACKGRSAWVNGKDLQPVRAYPYHPFRKGMRGVARQAYRQIVGRAAPHVTLGRPEAPTMPRRQQRRLGDDLTGALTGAR